MEIEAALLSKLKKIFAKDALHSIKKDIPLCHLLAAATGSVKDDNEKVKQDVERLRKMYKQVFNVTDKPEWLEPTEMGLQFYELEASLMLSMGEGVECALEALREIYWRRNRFQGSLVRMTCDELTILHVEAIKCGDEKLEQICQRANGFGMLDMLEVEFHVKAAQEQTWIVAIVDCIRKEMMETVKSRMVKRFLLRVAGTKVDLKEEELEDMCGRLICSALEEFQREVDMQEGDTMLKVFLDELEEEMNIVKRQATELYVSLEANVEMGGFSHM